MKNTKIKPPVTPIGRILYTDVYPDFQFGYLFETDGPAKFDRIVKCRDFSEVKPFGVYKARAKVDAKPFKVVFSWSNSKAGLKTVTFLGRKEKRLDENQYHILEILEEHTSLSTAQKSMRAFAAEVDKALNKPAKNGGKCHNKICGVDGKLRKAVVGEYVTYARADGIIFAVTGERFSSGAWSTIIKPAYSFFSTSTDRYVAAYDGEQMISVVNIADVGAKFAELQLFLQEIAKTK